MHHLSRIVTALREDLSEVRDQQRETRADIREIRGEVKELRREVVSRSHPPGRSAVSLKDLAPFLYALLVLAAWAAGLLDKATATRLLGSG